MKKAILIGWLHSLGVFFGISVPELALAQPTQSTLPSSKIIEVLPPLVPNLDRLRQRPLVARHELSKSESYVVSAHVRPCFQLDGRAQGLAAFSVHIIVEIDETGMVREAEAAPEDRGKLNTPFVDAYTRRAIDAVMNFQCAYLPLPARLLGQNNTIEFDFTP